jgi:hypothetical protein
MTSNEVAVKSRKIDGFEGYVDAVEGAEEQRSNQVIQGDLIKFTNDSDYVLRDGTKIADGFEAAVVDIRRLSQKWIDQLPVETRILGPGEKFPDIKKLNEACPKAEWTEGPSGEKRGPWQNQHVVYLLDPLTMARFTYATGTVGGTIAVRDLAERTTWMRKYRGESVYPVVTLSDTFMPTRFGGRQRPFFKIMRWITFGPGGDTLPASEQPALPAREQSGGAKTVDVPTAKEVTGDEVRY